MRPAVDCHMILHTAGVQAAYISVAHEQRTTSELPGITGRIPRRYQDAWTKKYTQNTGWKGTNCTDKMVARKLL
jgi:hypothetical protein